MTVEELINEVSTHIHDPAQVLVNDQQVLMFINSAARDLRNSGWYIPLEEDESITQVEDDFVYTIPATFVLISSLRWEDESGDATVYDSEIPFHQWEIGYDGGVAVIRFNSHLWAPAPGDTIKVIGQKRPTIYTAITETVDPGTETFLRERAVSHCCRYLKPGNSQYAGTYAQMGEEAYRNSLEVLRYQPQQFRMNPDARVVPGR